MPVDPLSLALMAVNIGTSIFNNWRNNKQSHKLQEKQQEFARAAAERNKQRMWQLMREGQELALEMERETHENRLEDIRNDFDRILYRLAYAQAINSWPLKVLPIVMKNQSLGSLTSTADENIAMHCILTPSNCVQFNKYILPIIEEKLADFCNLHWSTLSSHPILFYSGAWKTGTIPTGVEVSQLKTNLNNLPTLLITPFFKPEGGIVFQINAWGIGVELETEIECADFSYAESYKSSIDYQTEEDIKERTIEEFVPYLQCLIGYIADQYFWTNHNEPPLLPTLLAENAIFTDGMQYLNAASRSVYDEMLKNNLSNELLAERNMSLLKSVSPIMKHEYVNLLSTELFFKYCSCKEGFDANVPLVEYLIREDFFTAEDTKFLDDFNAVHWSDADTSHDDDISNGDVKENFKVNGQTYIQKRNELIDIINDTTRIEGIPEVCVNELESIKRKCQENQFNIVLIGEFQGGKSTTFNAFCDGREISPRGFGIKTSACRISATNIVDNNKDEWAYITWKTDQEILLNISNLLSKYIRREDLDVEETDYRPIHEILDLNNENHIHKIEEAIMSEHKANIGGEHTEEYDLCIIAQIVLKFYNSEELRRIKEKNIFEIKDVAKFVTFPENLNEDAYNHFEGCSVNDYIFAFIADVQCHIHSENLKRIGCTIVDCPGLFVSEWDTQVAFDSLKRSDAIIYLVSGEKEMSMADEKALRIIKSFNSASITNKMFVAMNTRKGKKATEQIVAKNQLKLANLGFENTEIHKFNAQLMFLGAFARMVLYDYNDGFSKERFVSIQALNDIEDHDIRNVWTRSVNRCYSNLSVCGPDGEVLRVKNMFDNDINEILNHSGSHALFDKIEDFVIEKKSYSILVESGATSVLNSLHELSSNFKKQEDDSIKTIEEFNSELRKSEKVFLDLQKEINQILEDEKYDDSVIKPIASNGYDTIFSEKKQEQIAVNITNDISKELKSIRLRGRMLAASALKILDESRSREIKEEVSAIFERIITKHYRESFENAISGWSNDVINGENEAYKNYAKPVFQRIDRDIRRCWNRCRDENITCFSIKKLPHNLYEINNKITKGKPSSELIASCLLKSVSENSMEIIVRTVITGILAYVGAWIGVFIAELFTGTIWIQLIAGILGMFATGTVVGSHYLRRSYDELDKEEQKIYKKIYSTMNASIEEQKQNLISLLKKVPKLIVENYKGYYHDELSSIETKLKADIELRREAKRESLENHRDFIYKMSSKRKKEIEPMIERLKHYIKSCCA